ncbi:hypothetical protein GGS21DRAFT_489150 [Xylaria nigripes]|nr:hypothetical protein GGS21DRAFT_489150 [Xylaria nigripes]
MAPPGTPKTMSSRLLTMKFMQRAAASNSSPSSAPSTPASSDSHKRRKISHDTTPQQNVDTFVNQVAVRAAIAEEEKKVENAKLKRAEELGDAHWVLDISQQPQLHMAQTPMKVVHVGFGQIDSMGDMESEDESADASHYGTPAIRRYNMDKKKATDKKKESKKDHNSSSESSSGSNSDASFSSSSSDDDDDGTSGRQSFGSHSQSSSTTQSVSQKPHSGKRSKDKLKAMQFAEKRRKKELNLNSPKGGITSISAGGGPSLQQSMNLTCFRCGRPGHKSVQCKRPDKRQAR